MGVFIESTVEEAALRDALLPKLLSGQCGLEKR